MHDRGAASIPTMDHAPRVIHHLIAGDFDPLEQLLLNRGGQWRLLAFPGDEPLRQVVRGSHQTRRPDVAQLRHVEKPAPGVPAVAQRLTWHDFPIVVAKESSRHAQWPEELSLRKFPKCLTRDLRHDLRSHRVAAVRIEMLRPGFEIKRPLTCEYPHYIRLADGVLIHAPAGLS